MGGKGNREMGFFFVKEKAFIISAAVAEKKLCLCVCVWVCGFEVNW